jgi:hypothetical protein
MTLVSAEHGTYINHCAGTYGSFKMMARQEWLICNFRSVLNGLWAKSRSALAHTEPDPI